MLSGTTPLYNAPYRMTSMEMKELVTGLQKILDKSTTDSVCPHGQHMLLCKEERWNYAPMQWLLAVK